jgi:hypothetical protein
MTNELLNENPNRILTNSTLLKIGEQYYQTKPLCPMDFTVNGFGNEGKNFNLDKGVELDPTIAYLDGDYYYFYKGKLSDIKGFNKVTPGVYYDDESCNYVICNPETPEEIEEYRYADKITRQDADEIRSAVLNHEVVIFNTPDASHSSIPPESLDDDILKKLIKRAISKKGVDLDQYKIRFASKNMLFNTKQVLRGPNRLSMLLFDRCTEALNLKYTIILEEAGGETIGHPLDSELIISSQDVFDANIDQNKSDEVE